MSQQAETSPAAPSWEEARELLERLPQLTLESRIEAVERLVRSPSPEIRDAALRVGAAVLDDERLAEQLRSRSDAAARNAALEILKLRGDRAFPLAKELLDDSNEQVVLQAIQILDHLRDPRAIEPLRCMLRHEDPNVVQHGIVALGHIGDDRVIPDLMAFLDADTWLQIGAVSALGDLRARQAVPALRRLLDDSLVGPAAAEALARIGGADAFRALAGVWLVPDLPVLDVQALELLAHVLEGLSEIEADLRDYVDRFAPALGASDPNVSAAGARCAVALGPSPHDELAVSLLAEAKTGSPNSERRFGHRDVSLPACLASRVDLIPRFMLWPGLPRCWGFLLATRHPGQAPVEAIALSCSRSDDPVCADCATRALQQLDDPRLAAAAMDLYARVPPGERHRLRPLLRRHGSGLGADEAPDTDDATRVLLAEIRGQAPEAVAEQIAGVPAAERRSVVMELCDRPEILRLLPWRDWVSSNPEIFAPLAAEVALEADLRELLPVLRGALSRSPHAAVIRTLGAFGDQESVPTLLEHLTAAEPLTRVQVLEALGRIGGDAARAVLREAASDPNSEVRRVAIRALSSCASRDDLELFRQVARDADWFLRLASADTLRSLWHPDSRAALELLAADPHPLVARTARAALDQGDDG